MPLKTFFFNPRAFRKDISRFSPAWYLYLIFAFFILIVPNGFQIRQTNIHSFFSEALSILSVLNLLYALLTAILLFGDLTNSRLCFALHAMPVRREGWFFTHVAAGLCFSIVPNTVLCLCFVAQTGGLWIPALMWLLGAELEYLFFFGVATFSMFLTANRFASSVVYGIINFFSMLIYGFISAVYLPYMKGLVLNSEQFDLFCPVRYLVAKFSSTFMQDTFTNNWGYLSVLAGIGIALLALSLLLYRKRNMECAGDFMAFKWLSPIFAVLFSMVVAVFFLLLQELFFGSDQVLLFMIIGLTVGFFCSMMLIQRRVAIFKVKNFLYWIILLAVCLCSVFCVKADFLGITKRVPAQSDVESVEIANSYHYYAKDSALVLSKQEDIAKVLKLHAYASQLDDSITGNRTSITIRYQLSGGRTMIREYSVPFAEPAAGILTEFFSRPEFVLGSDDLNWLKEHLKYVQTDEDILPEQQSQELLEALFEDCRERNALQDWGAHEDTTASYWCELCFSSGESEKYVDVFFFSDAVHTCEWMKQNGYILEK